MSVTISAPTHSGIHRQETLLTADKFFQEKFSLFSFGIFFPGGRRSKKDFPAFLIQQFLWLAPFTTQFRSATKPIPAASVIRPADNVLLLPVTPPLQ
ncbi:TPA: hypothetical protein N3A08_004645 [Salmonella enterica subsp. salamae serovar 9,46:z4,z24:z39:z42]|nr:hypothetical protein [Salmonella enterica subsp. salamae serovar 9,46:z4,z24:z39:z42]